MSTALEQAWKELGATWRTDEFRAQSPGEALRARVDRQTRRMRWFVAVEIVITVLMLHLAAAAIIKSGGTGAVRLSVMVLLYVGGVWAFALWNRRGTWSPYGEATADFIDLLRLRARRRMRSAGFCIAIVSVALLFMRRAITAAWVGASMPVWDRVIFIAFGAYSLGIIVWGLWYLRSARRELRSLEAMQRELGIT